MILLLIRFILLFLFSSLAFAGYKDLPPEVKAALSKIKKHPKAQNITLWGKESYLLNADGSQTTDIHSFRYFKSDTHVKKARYFPMILKDSWSYNDENKVEVLAARVYTQAGGENETNSNDIHEAAPRELENLTDFSRFKQKIVSFHANGNGDIIELHYRYTTPKPSYPVFCKRIYLREQEPIISHEITIEIPERRELNYKLAGGASEPQKNGNVYSWKIGEMADYDKNDLNGDRDQLPQISFSDVKDWTQLQSMLRIKVIQASADNIIIPESLTEKITGVSDPENKLDSIKIWAREHLQLIQYDDLEFKIYLRPCAQVFNSGYGNSFEMAALVSKLANELGLSTSIMLEYDGEALVPTLDGVKGGLVEFKTDDLYFLCDPLLPRREISQASLVGNTLVPVTAQGTVSVMPSINYASNRYYLHIAFDKLDNDTLTGFGTLTTTGQLAPYEQVRENGAEAYLKTNWPQFEFTQTKVKELMLGMVTIDFSFKAIPLTPPLKHGEALFLGLMNFELMTGAIPTNLPKREYAQKVMYPGDMRLEIEAPLPENWALTKFPANLSKQFPWGEYKAETMNKDNRIHFNRSMILKDPRIPAKDWSDFRNWIMDSESSSNTLLFSKE